jgi:hypothetical protein
MMDKILAQSLTDLGLWVWNVYDIDTNVYQAELFAYVDEAVTVLKKAGFINISGKQDYLTGRLLCYVCFSYPPDWKIR